jgi:hypothetical protein
MAINRYDQPAEAQFINTYTPIPFDDLLKVGMLKQARVEKGQQEMDATNDYLRSIPVAPADEEALNEKMKIYRGQLDEGLKYGVGSQDQINSAARVKNAILADEDIRKFIHNRKIWDQDIKTASEAAKDPNIPENLASLTRNQRDLGYGGPGSKKGLYSPATFNKYVDVYEAMEKRVNDVSDSSFGEAGISLKDGNKYIVETTHGEKTLNALGAPLGIVFTKNEKGEAIIDITKSNIGVFMSSSEGAQLRQIATERSEGDPDKYNQILQEQYYGHAIAAIKERVSSKSTISISGDPYGQIDYKKKVEDMINPRGVPLSVATSASKLTSFDKTKEMSNILDGQIKEKEANLNKTLKTEGITKQGNIYLDNNNVDVSGRVLGLQSEIEDIKGQKESIASMLKRVKDEAGIPQEWEVNPVTKEDAEKAGTEERIRFLRQIKAGDTRMNTSDEMNKADKAAEIAKNKYIEKNDPNWSALNKALAENAEKSAVITTVTPYALKSLNEGAMADYPLLMQNEAQWVGTKETIQESEKEKLRNLTANQTSTNPERVIFGGPMIDPESQKEKYVYQAYDAKGNLSRPFMVDAPVGTVDNLIRAGVTTKARHIMHQQLTRLYVNPDKVTEVTLGTGDGTEGKVRMIQKSGYNNAVEGSQFKLITNIKGPDGVVRPTEDVFNSITEVMDRYEAYVIAEMANRQSEK